MSIKVPSTKSMQTMNQMLQNMCGIETIPFNGKLGHKYHVNNIAQILAQVSIRISNSFVIL